MLLVEKARLNHWIEHTKQRVEAAVEVHTEQGGAVAAGKVSMLQEWGGKLDALAMEVQLRLSCIPTVGSPMPAEAERGPESEHGSAFGSGSESEKMSGSESN